MIGTLSSNKYIPAIAAIICIAVMVATEQERAEEAERQRSRQLSEDSVVDLVSHVKRAISNQGNLQEPAAKRRMIIYDRDRARQSVHNDYMGSPTPRFADKQFERIFRVTRQIADRLLRVAAISDKFFRDSIDCTGRQSICPKVKLLMALKMKAYGDSGSAFVDYFQMY